MIQRVHSFYESHQSRISLACYSLLLGFTIFSYPAWAGACFGAYPGLVTGNRWKTVVGMAVGAGAHLGFVFFLGGFLTLNGVGEVPVIAEYIPPGFHVAPYAPDAPDNPGFLFLIYIFCMDIVACLLMQQKGEAAVDLFQRVLFGWVLFALAATVLCFNTKFDGILHLPLEEYTFRATVEIQALVLIFSAHLIYAFWPLTVAVEPRLPAAGEPSGLSGT